MQVQVRNETIELLPQRGLYWPRHQLLAISDLHIGKAESYQAAGVPVPSGAHLEDFINLQTIIQVRDIQKVIIVGDLIHNKFSWTDEILQDLQNFISSFSEISWHLVYGNHERGSLEFLKKLPLKFYQESYVESPFEFTHGHDGPSEGKKDLFQIQGHIHPQISLREGVTRIQLPCFHLSQNTLTLPAFGTLTGGYTIRPTKKDRVFALTGKEIFEVPATPTRS